MRRLMLLLAGLLLSSGLHAAEPAKASKAPAAKPVVVMETNLGKVVVELEPAKAPKTVSHFLAMVDSGDYDNTLFHRVIAGFVVQGGGVSADSELLREGDSVVNESAGGLSNVAGTIAMARRPDPHSATRQFFFNLSDNSATLDARGDRLGYTVFGRVISGMDVLDSIASLPTRYDGKLNYDDVPVKPVILNKAYRQP